MGDLNFGMYQTRLYFKIQKVNIICLVLGYYESAIKYYLEAIMVASDFFSQPIPRSQIDDLVYRRMIKCCAHLQCYTQAAVLCQFLEEVDYTLAFKWQLVIKKVARQQMLWMHITIVFGILQY